MKFVQATYNNLGPFTHASIKLADRGLVLIQGDNQESTSSDSNGSGKSFVLEGIVWAITGKTIRWDLNREKTGDQIIKNRGPDAGKNCYSWVEIEADGHKVEIIRYRKLKAGLFTTPDGGKSPSGSGLLFYVDAVDMTKGSVAETEKSIEELLGLDFDSFIRSVYFDGHNIPSFPTLADADIKRVFERLLSLDDLKKAAEVVKKRKTEANSLLNAARSQAAMIQSEVSTADVEMRTAQVRASGWDTNQINNIAAKEAHAKSLATTLKDESLVHDALNAIDVRENELRVTLKRFDNLPALKQTIADELVRLRSEKAGLERQAQEIERHKQIVASQEVNHQRALAQQIAGVDTQTPHEFAVRRSKHEYAFRDAANKSHAAEMTLKNVRAKIGTPCGECGKPYVEHDLDTIMAHAQKTFDEHFAIANQEKALIATIDKEIVEWRVTEKARIAATPMPSPPPAPPAVTMAGTDYDAAIAAELQKQEATQQVEQRRDALTAELHGLPLRRSELNRVFADNASIKRDIAAFEAEVIKLRAETNPYKEDVERWQTRKTDAESRLSVVWTNITELDHAIFLLEVQDKCYGRQGMKTDILETITPALNQKANEYANAMTDGAVAIEFSTLTKNKDGSMAERFSVGVKNSQGAEAYLGNSSGERKKIDVAIAIAMSDLVAARASKQVDLWCADEIAESLDPTALERVVDLLKRKASERGTILCISHSDMTPFIPNVVTVRKTAAGSEIL